MNVATIVRDDRGNLFIRLGKRPQTGGNVTVIDTLSGVDLVELKHRAERFVQELSEKED